MPADNAPNHRKVSPARAREMLAEYIVAQRLQSGDKVPSERSLSDILAISRRSVTGALDDLVTEGVLVRRPRSGTYVARAGESVGEARPRTIAVVMPWLAGRTPGYESTPNPQTPLFRIPFGSESMTLQIMHGIVAAANEHKARIVTCANNSPEEERDIVRQISEEEISGVIVMPRRENTGVFAEVVSAGKPLTFIDHYFSDIPADRVVTANRAAAREAVLQLVAQGHRRIAFFTSFSDMTSIADREAGYRAALEESGIAYDEDIVRGYEAMPRHNWGYELALEHCTRLADPVTAVFCVDDFAVEKTLAAAAKLGLAIPHDLAVTGFFEYQLPDSLPIPFTRIVQDKFTIGQTAASLVLGRMTGEVSGPPTHTEVPASIVPGNV